MAQLLKAKQEAIQRFLPSRRERAVISGYSFSSEPRANIVGVGMGRRQENGSSTQEQAIRFYVERKLPKTSIPSHHLIPSKICGIRTDVVETGRFRAFSSSLRVETGEFHAFIGPPPLAQRRLRPAQPGCSIGFRDPANQFLMAGTFGALVKKNGSSMILSNNHVLANQNRLRRGAQIFQPGLLDRGDVSSDQIARLTEFVRLSKAKRNIVDCAISELSNDSIAIPKFLSPIGDLKSTSPVEAAEDMRVHKVGRTTEYTKGAVFDISADVNVEYDIGVLSFSDQILIRGERGTFSAAGDSGSVIVDRDSGRAVGLLFGGSSSVTIANHLTEVLRKLRARLAG